MYSVLISKYNISFYFDQHLLDTLTLSMFLTYTVVNKSNRVYASYTHNFYYENGRFYVREYGDDYQYEVEVNYTDDADINFYHNIINFNVYGKSLVIYLNSEDPIYVDIGQFLASHYENIIPEYNWEYYRHYLDDTTELIIGKNYEVYLIQNDTVYTAFNSNPRVLYKWLASYFDVPYIENFISTVLSANMPKFILSNFQIQEMCEDYHKFVKKNNLNYKEKSSFIQYMKTDSIIRDTVLIYIVAIIRHANNGTVKEILQEMMEW